jgi:hypothetical protein
MRRLDLDAPNERLVPSFGSRLAGESRDTDQFGAVEYAHHKRAVSRRRRYPFRRFLDGGSPVFLRGGKERLRLGFESFEAQMPECFCIRRRKQPDVHF